MAGRSEMLSVSGRSGNGVPDDQCRPYRKHPRVNSESKEVYRVISVCLPLVELVYQGDFNEHLLAISLSRLLPLYLGKVVVPVFQRLDF